MIIILLLLLLFICLYVYNSTSGGSEKPKHFLVLRHSERTDTTRKWSEEKKIRPFYDTTITDNLVYFKRFYKHFKPVIQSFNKIYCSPFSRCIQTAMLINSKLQKPLLLCIEPGLIELSSLEYYLQNDYFSNSQIYERFGKHIFDTHYMPVYTPAKLEKYLKSPFSYEIIKKKLKSLMKKIDSGIMVSHREMISVTDGKNDDYCGASYVSISENKIVLLDSF